MGAEEVVRTCGRLTQRIPRHHARLVLEKRGALKQDAPAGSAETPNIGLAGLCSRVALMPGKRPRSRVPKSGVVMLQQLGDRISACLERAEQCREAAASEIDERVRQQLLDLEQQWQQVVESYQFIESLGRLLLDQRPLPPEVEMLPKDFPPE
jgi:hypothetical protein